VGLHLVIEVPNLEWRDLADDFDFETAGWLGFPLGSRFRGNDGHASIASSSIAEARATSFALTILTDSSRWVSDQVGDDEHEW